MTEVPPLFVVEFLHRVVDTFEDYFSECSESSIKVLKVGDVAKTYLPED